MILTVQPSQRREMQKYVCKDGYVTCDFSFILLFFFIQAGLLDRLKKRGFEIKDYGNISKSRENGKHLYRTDQIL